MANEEHLKILLQGVEVWNRWRNDNPEIEPDLREADLKKAELNQINLRKTNLCRASLSGAHFKKADLGDANLSGAYLINGNLKGANLTRANLNGARLILANLRNANFSGAHLSYANFTNAKLSGIDLSGAYLYGANLSVANLTGANLQNTNLQATRLINTKLDGANLTDALLWETQRAGWSIKDVRCESVYWNREANEKTEYASGEFERLFADQAKIRLFYKDGITPLEIATLPALIQHLEDKQGSTLRFVSINESAGGTVVELVIENTRNQSSEELKQLKAALEDEAQRGIEYQKQALAEREIRLQLQGGLEESRRMFSEFITNQKPIYLLNSQGDIKMSDDKSSKYTNTGYVGAMGDNAQAHNVNFNQPVNNVGESIDLVALAKELATLRVEIAKMQDSSPQAMLATGEIVRAEIAAGEKDTPKVLGHLKAAGQWALDAATKVGATIVAEVIKKSMGL
jgi:hypothetical protein